MDQKQKIDVGLFYKEELIGWSYGWHGGVQAATYYMANSCVFPEFRRKGYYSKMLEKVLEIANELGFQVVISRHVAANNPVIIAKLKLGFKVTGMELSEIHGNLICLTYFNNKHREEAYEVRSGYKKTQKNSILSIFSSV